MTITSETKIIRKMITEGGMIQVTSQVVFTEDGKETGRAIKHQHVITPGDDYSNEVEEVRALADLIHTDDVVAAYQRDWGSREPRGA
jgi:hypothetical protein